MWRVTHVEKDENREVKPPKLGGISVGEGVPSKKRYNTGINRQEHERCSAFLATLSLLTRVEKRSVLLRCSGMTILLALQ